MEAELDALRVRPIEKSEEGRYRELMAQHHYLGDLAKIGHTLWYVATSGEDWAALLSFWPRRGNVGFGITGSGGISGISMIVWG